MIKEINGDLFNSTTDVIGHGCNCVGGFGNGIAGQIANTYPRVRRAYLNYHDNIGWILGDIQLVNINDSRMIANCATQKEYLPRDKQHADYNAIRLVCLKLKDFCVNNDKTLALPRIGCGLAGGDWKEVKKIYEEVFEDFEVEVYYL